MSNLLATADATKAYADKCWRDNPTISPDSWRVAEGLTLGKIGFSAHHFLGRPQQAEALQIALGLGVNVVALPEALGRDFNARWGAVRQVLEQCPREEVVLVAQVGLCEKKSIQNQLDSYAPWRVDVVLLTMEGEVDYEQIQTQFVALEKLAQAGEIQFYGVRGIGLCQAENAADFVDLSRVFECAQAAAQQVYGRKKRPMFRALGVPLNMLQMQAIRQVNQRAKSLHPKWEALGGEPVPVLELASRMHLAVFAESPLESVWQGTPVRLCGELAAAPAPAAQQKLAQESLRNSLKNLKKAEEELNKALGGWPSVAGSVVFNLAQHGRALWDQIQPLPLAARVVDSVLTPTLELMEETLPPSPEKEAYKEAMEAVVLHVRQNAHCQNSLILQPVVQALNGRVGASPDWQKASVQQVALNAIGSIPGVTCVLAGLRQPTYVHEVSQLYQKGDFTDVAQVLGGREGVV